MKTRQSFLIAGGLFTAAILYTLTLYPRLPERIPIHWNLQGQIDGWGAKWWAAWQMPGVMLLFIGLQAALPVMSPRQFSIAPFRKTFDYLMLVCVALMGYLHVLLLQAALYPDLDFGRSLMVGLFLFIALIGNVIGRTRRNLWMGIRTPWTLANDTVWAATHRLAGYLLTGAGILGVITIWIGAPIVLCIAFLLVALLIPAAYSYVLYKRVGGNAA